MEDGPGHKGDETASLLQLSAHKRYHLVTISCSIWLHGRILKPHSSSYVQYAEVVADLSSHHQRCPHLSVTKQRFPSNQTEALE